MTPQAWYRICLILNAFQLSQRLILLSRIERIARSAVKSSALDRKLEIGKGARTSATAFYSMFSRNLRKNEGDNIHISHKAF